MTVLNSFKQHEIKPDFLLEQSKITQFAPRGLSTNDQQLFEEILVMSLITTGTSFYRIGNPYFQNSNKILNVNLPDRKKLSGSLLDHFYNKEKAKLDQFFRANDHVSLHQFNQ